MNQTPNYQLNQWEKTDQIRMEDFNADNAKIEAALASTGNCHIISGSWVGNGQGDGNRGTGQTITLPTTPKFMVIFGQYTDSSSSKPLVAFVSQNGNLCFHSNSPTFNSDYVTLSGNQLELTFRYFLNGSGIVQNYIAFT